MLSPRSSTSRVAAGLVSLVAVTAAARAQQGGAKARSIALVHVSVIPMDQERVLADQTVLVQDGRIIALGPAKKVRLPAHAKQVDGRGKFLIPGLADMHAHITPWERLRRADTIAQRFDDSFEQSLGRAGRLLFQEQQLFLWLAHGLTTVRNLDHHPSHLGRDLRSEDVLQLRARAAAGEILSPRIYTSGYIAGQFTRSDTTAPLQLAEVAEAVRTYKAAGFDFIKMHPSTLPYPPDSVFDSLVVMARQVGLPLVGHSVVPLERALQTYRSIEHLNGYTEGSSGALPVLPWPTSMAELDSLAPRIRELAVATRKAGVWNCPTLYNAFRNGESPLALGLKRRLVKALQNAGAGLLAGSDRLQVPRWFSADSIGLATLRRNWTMQEQRLDKAYGDAGATHRELEALVEAGLTPYQALATATRNPAVYFGMLDSTGTIALGKRADLVLLNGNPLRDIRQTEQIVGVMLGGRWLDRAALDQHTAEISAWLERRCRAVPAAGQTSCPVKLDALKGEP